MKVSSKGRYALRLMIDIAENGANGWVTLKEVSERQDISVKYLEQIVRSLTKPGLLKSGRGAGGGYMLTKPPGSYTAGEILRAAEGKLAPVVCLEDEENGCGRRHSCPTVKFWEGLCETVNGYTDSVTLRDFMRGDSSN